MREVIKQTSLVQEMKRLYVSDEHTVAEAVDLGLLYLRFIDAIHKAKEIAIKNEFTEIGKIDDFFFHLVIETFSIDSYDGDKEAINYIIDEIGDKDVSYHLMQFVNTIYLDILKNKFFNHPGCNVVLRPLIIEAVLRIKNAYYFIFNDEKDLSYANFHSTGHPLAMIAFLCTRDVTKYDEMNMIVERYFAQSSKKLCET